MSVKLLVFLLISCQTILNESSSLVKAENQSNSTSTKNSTIPKGYTIFPEFQAAYKVHTSSKTWYEARDTCIAEGARLAIVDSHDKIRRINSLPFAQLKRLHVGIYRSTNTGEWLRVDNDQPVSSVPWKSGTDQTDNCVGTSIFGNGLITYSCNFADSFVCEIPV